MTSTAPPRPFGQALQALVMRLPNVSMRRILAVPSSAIRHGFRVVRRQLAQDDLTAAGGGQ